MSKGDNFANGALVTRAGNAKKSSEELNGISESAQEQHEMELQALFDQLELEEGEEVQFPYLVRGAELYCNCGTHKRRLNLPICHGVYTNGQPMMHEEDCEVGDDKNIPSFGICQSEENPVNKSWLAKTAEKIKNFFTGEEEDEDADKIILQTEDGQNVKGYPCTPCIVGTWKDVYESEKILRNNADGTSEGDKLSALTQRAFLVCAYGGLIEPISSGQEEE
ncbi:MAG: DUF4280 domain-containing protein [Roseburia intestinalis]